jgi:hypothetical protein
MVGFSHGGWEINCVIEDFVSLRYKLRSRAVFP